MFLTAWLAITSGNVARVLLKVVSQTSCGTIFGSEGNRGGTNCPAGQLGGLHQLESFSPDDPGRSLWRRRRPAVEKGSREVPAIIFTATALDDRRTWCTLNR